MLISFIAMFILSVAAGWKSLLAQVWPIVPEEPTTFQLALAGIATLAVYSLAGRHFRRRRIRMADGRRLGASETPVDGESISREAA